MISLLLFVSLTVPTDSPSPLSSPIEGGDTVRESYKGGELLAANPPHVTATSPSEHDADGDGVMDPYDNCPTIANPDQLNTTGGPFGDACVAPDVTLPKDTKLRNTLRSR